MNKKKKEQVKIVVSILLTNIFTVMIITTFWEAPSNEVLLPDGHVEVKIKAHVVANSNETNITIFQKDSLTKINALLLSVENSFMDQGAVKEARVAIEKEHLLKIFPNKIYTIYPRSNDYLYKEESELIF